MRDQVPPPILGEALIYDEVIAMDDEDDVVPAGDDAWTRVDVSTEELAEQERQDAARADADAATASDRNEEGRFHSRSQGDRDETGGA